LSFYLRKFFLLLRSTLFGLSLFLQQTLLVQRKSFLLLRSTLFGSSLFLQQTLLMQRKSLPETLFLLQQTLLSFLLLRLTLIGSSLLLQPTRKSFPLRRSKLSSFRRSTLLHFRHRQCLKYLTKIVCFRACHRLGITNSAPATIATVSRWYR